jgi:hypothetical protein
VCSYRCLADKRYILKERLTYVVDNTSKHGTVTMVLALGIGTIAIVLLTAVVLVIAG